MTDAATCHPFCMARADATALYRVAMQLSTELSELRGFVEELEDGKNVWPALGPWLETHPPVLSAVALSPVVDDPTIAAGFNGIADVAAPTHRSDVPARFPTQ